MTETVHLQLRFPYGGTVLDYRASPTVAAGVAAEFTRRGVEVRVDDAVTERLADLPHAELWTP
ncbi:hypothetical protein [Nocardia blacklockiae]|uniref:hypothetical protein n=1 Tax=Nocardia blacklockiae TaxID=480036 RepID=UPI001894949E|nr:hypothetical protein [Nocardia blacklockiae]MBF6171929.1 hypothetical protein [Nocardia blacklockiae]